MIKRKADYPQTEVEIEAGGTAPAESGGEGMEQGLFENLLVSVGEAGAILRASRKRRASPASRRSLVM